MAQGNRETIFIGDAIQLIGKLKFGEAWTGDELSAERRASSRPSFSGTLEYYWEQVRRTFPANTFTVTSLASWNGTVPPPFATLSSISPREANAQRSARAKKLVQEGPSFALRMTSTSQTGRNAKMIMTAQSNDCGGYWTGLLRQADLGTSKLTSAESIARSDQVITLKHRKDSGMSKTPSSQDFVKVTQEHPSMVKSLKISTSTFQKRA
jgi:hypothetical protein